jgi:hypothetical protein
MSDLLEHWKKNRFVTVGQELLEGPEMLVILTDINYWAKNLHELETWCTQNGAVSQGMTVTFPDKKTMTAFCLKWT